MAVVAPSTDSSTALVRASGRVPKFIHGDGQRLAPEPGQVDVRGKAARLYPLTIAADDFAFDRQHLKWSKWILCLCHK
jgi:hypothetical protein